ncbi:MAG TPA: hypothetical protein DD723_08760 [Candidatus Omnitrophica bacterium]|nr:MAG: hypothetical protein A2Z81_07005 [Omnitrophica WOR_2 bacterium GWA2_45_18]OGX19077.1 MAG: hypothetical protein A2Y04_04590 [Omnitrophica WOR_2 bacterium GWC2_45_7]HBR15609.1 hypothetical protein [Candidatus Omnitrophota bacterium]
MSNTRQGLLFFVIISAFSAFFFTSRVEAGWMDKLNAATQKINEASQKMGQQTPQTQTRKAQQAEDPDRPLHLEDYDKTGSCEGKRSATCMDYMELVDHCMDPLKGYRSKLYIELIEKKLKTETLDDQLRKNLEEDLAAFKEAFKNKTDNPTIAGEKNSSRYLSDVSEEDQVYVNAEHGIFYKKNYNKCMGADHMGTGKRTEMMQDTETISGEEAVAKLRKKKAKEEEPFNCLKNLSNLRWKVMADVMEAKMKRLNPTGKERAEWEADIASIRDVAQTGAPGPTPPDPSNPTRYMLRLDSNEQVVMMQEYSRQSQEETAKCSAMAGSGKIEERPVKSGGLVDKSKSPANKQAKVQKVKEYTQEELNYGRGGSTNLLALRRDRGCADALIGHLAKLTADKLEAKLKATSGLDAQKRKEWEEDIAAWRAAGKAGKDSAESPGDDPYRWQDRLTREERQEINMQHVALNNKLMKECNSKPSGL